MTPTQERREPVSNEAAEWVTRDSLARALHATAPHSKLHPWDSCPQQDFDYNDADAILDAVRLQESV